MTQLVAQSDKRVKISKTNMLYKVGKNTVETNKKSKVHSKEREPIKKNQVEILKLKNTIAKKKFFFNH